MINRYPHEVELIFNTKTTGSTTGLIGEDTDSTKKYCLQGRMELSKSVGTKFEGVFYTKQSGTFADLEHREGKLKWAGREFNIMRIQPFQTHTEIWLS